MLHVQPAVHGLSLLLAAVNASTMRVSAAPHVTDKHTSTRHTCHESYLDSVNPVNRRICQQLCRFSLLSGQNVRWPRRMLPPGESRWVCRRDRQTDRQTHWRKSQGVLGDASPFQIVGTRPPQFGLKTLMQIAPRFYFSKFQAPDGLHYNTCTVKSLPTSVTLTAYSLLPQCPQNQHCGRIIKHFMARAWTPIFLPRPLSGQWGPDLTLRPHQAFWIRPCFPQNFSQMCATGQTDRRMQTVALRFPLSSPIWLCDEAIWQPVLYTSWTLLLYSATEHYNTQWRHSL